jgi:hypothetical protein
VLVGKVSPIYYYMVLEDLTLSELSSRAGIRKGKVKKHLEAGHFNDISQGTLQLYADVFNITIQDILKILVGDNDDSIHSKSGS